MLTTMRAVGTAVVIGALGAAQALARALARRALVGWTAPVVWHRGPWCFGPHERRPSASYFYTLRAAPLHDDWVERTLVHTVERVGSLVVTQGIHPYDEGAGRTWLADGCDELGGRERDALIARYGREG